MPNNIEIKARVNAVEATRQLVEKIAGQAVKQFRQHDTFFVTAKGRLKLREFSNRVGELIYYLRDDHPGPSGSFYQISPTDDPAGLRRLLGDALGIRGEVVKTRRLYKVGRTRIHIDAVEHLGDFLELEVVLDDGEDPSVGIQEAQEIMSALQIDEEQLVLCAYIDLITGDD